MISIRIENSIVNFYKGGYYSPVYSIGYDELPMILNLDGDNISEWVHQLMDITWISSDDLYRLAKMIQSKFPANDINWMATFIMVEKMLYLEYIVSIKEKNSDNKTSYFEGLKVFVDSGIEEATTEVNMKIEKIVALRLTEYGLQYS